MTFNHTNIVKITLEDAGFMFVKRECDGHWEILMDGQMIGQSRALGDLVRKHAEELGVW